jgi:hypothetical protein
MSISIRYAESDDDVVAIHRFLCVVAGPTLPGPIDHKDSAIEVWRVVKEDVALMAMNADNLMVGTMGIVRVPFWWNTKVRFLANRWFFTIPGSRAAKPLLREAGAIAKGSDLELHIFDERRGRLVISNKSKLRQEVPDVLR